ncbi:hypothetical protein BDM02DRAFT_3117317 [Thelephora ganbajun]|uniref:Uncharacterized protein n=1 Tax=Thelephora ganbajun TaxID=370292 RepID=A0ACB6ZCH1_THEGA|nr:hypothetical protein BDM02DRAFT_3117317 [Thelephora ganbajun]
MGVGPLRRATSLLPRWTWLATAFRTTRLAKVAAVQGAFASQPGGDRVEIVCIDDIIDRDFTKALEGRLGQRT